MERGILFSADDDLCGDWEFLLSTVGRQPGEATGMWTEFFFFFFFLGGGGASMVRLYHASITSEEPH